MSFPSNTQLDAILEQHLAILGKTGAGKTYAAKGMVEYLLGTQRRVCIIDPTGAWFGLRLKPDGETPSDFKPIIFGGKHADLPIAAYHGEALAEIIGNSRDSAIIDVSLMTVGERTKFFIGFGEAILRKNRGHLYVIIDEAHLFAPQGRVPDPASGQMLHAANNMVSMGRSRGLHVTMITQRPAKLHKDSLTQAATLVALRLIAPQDRGAVEAWIEDWADEKRGREVIASLPSMKRGQGWIWAPELDLLRKFVFPSIKTYDSGSGPEEDDRPLPRLDIEEISATLAIMAHDAVENDPKKLKDRIRALEAQIDAKAPYSEELIKNAEQKGYARGKIMGYQAALDAMPESLLHALSTIGKTAHDTYEQIERWRGRAPSGEAPPVKELLPPKESLVSSPLYRVERPEPRPKLKFVPMTGVAIGAPLGPAAIKLLTALTRAYPKFYSWDDIATIAGMLSGNGYFYGGKKELLSNGLAAEENGCAYATAAGQDIMKEMRQGAPPRPVSQDEIVQLWRGKLRSPAPQMLDVIYGAKRAVSVEELSQAIGAKPGNGYWYGGIAALRDAGLIVQGDTRGQIELAPLLRGDQ